MTDNSAIHPESKHLAHLVDLFLFRGAPVNNDTDHSVTTLVNHGYVCGYCPSRLQPLWSAYRVAGTDGDVDFDRPHLYYADERIEDSKRLDNGTFGKKDGIQYHVGHMVPNEVINRQFGRLAQLETFFMSNMSPQRGSLNTGVWLDLENKIRQIEDKPGKDHVWAIAGPVFGDNPETISRSDGKEVPIPEAYYYLTIDPFRYPYDKPGNQDIACFVFPQDAENGTPLGDFEASIQEIEDATKLTFMPGWDHDVARSALGALSGMGSPFDRHRLLAQL